MTRNLKRVIDSFERKEARIRFCLHQSHADERFVLELGTEDVRRGTPEVLLALLVLLGRLLDLQVSISSW